MKPALSIVWYGGPVLASISFSATIAAGQVACGDTITAKTVMTGNLSCVTDPAFTIGDGGSVDMAGYRVTTCGGCDGVALAGQGAKLSNGSIVGGGFGSSGVLLGGTGVHKVDNVVVVGAEKGFEATSDKNKLKNCAAYNAAIGFDIQGHKNAIGRSSSSGSTTANFRVNGNNNNLTEDASMNGSGAQGFLITGNANKLSRNTSSDDNGALGALSVSGNENKLMSNTVSGSTFTGLIIVGHENKVSKTVAAKSGTVGLNLFGGLNKLSKNAVYGSGSTGMVVSGSGNNVNGSTVNTSLSVGIWVLTGDANSLKSNVVLRNGTGIFVTAGVTNAAISKTIALENGRDLEDANSNCGGNVWTKNVFRTSAADGVADHACIQ